MKNLATIIEGTIVHILKIIPKEEKVMAEFEITLRDLKRESVERERGKRKERKEKNALQ